MTSPVQENQAQNAPQTEKSNDKEYNFRALEAKYSRELQAERQARMEAENAMKQYQIQNQKSDIEDDEEQEPYVAPKQLKKKLTQFGQNTQTEIQKAMEIAKNQAKEELKQEMYLQQNKDFYDVLQQAEKLAQHDPELAETILQMPNTFERQKLVYKNIKALGLDKPQQPKATIQDKIEANKKSPYYQPSGIGTAPYAQAGDFSPAGQKNAYEKLMQLKQNLRLG